MKPIRRRGIVLVALLVGGQLVPIQAVRALPADRHGVSLVQFDPTVPGDELLVRDREGHQVLVKLAEPEAVVDQVRIGLADLRLEPKRLLREGQELELAVRLVEQARRRNLVDLS